MTSQPGQQTNIIPVFSNFSKSKDNQTMKFDQLIEHKKRNSLLHKLSRT